MAESSTITTLRTKRDQIEGLIAHLEDRIKEARTDLAHVNATLRLFELAGLARESVRAYMNLNRVSPRGHRNPTWLARDRYQPVAQGCQTGSAVPERPLAHDLTGGIEKADLVPL